MKFKITIISILFNVVLFAQNTVGTLSLKPEAFDGYTLFTSYKNIFLINNCGQLINKWRSDFVSGHAAYLLPNGNLLRAGREDGASKISIAGAGGVIEMFNWQGDLIWQYKYNTEEYRQHHDIYPMPNGNILILAATVLSKEEAISLGRNPDLLKDSLYNEQIIEVKPIGNNEAEIVWEWNIKDHLVQDFDSSKSNYGVVKDNPYKLDVNFLNNKQVAKNWLHINSIQYDETLDQIILSSRLLSEIWIIDHSTTTEQAKTSKGGTYGKGGDLLYRWGNPQSYKHGNESDRKLYGQHYPYYVRNTETAYDGKIILFNNGSGREPSYSEVFILTPPTTSPGNYLYEKDIPFGPNQLDYSYSENINNSDFYSGITSGAQVLPNGNILVCEGREGYFFELDKNNNKVWEYLNPTNSNSDDVSEQFGSPQNAKLVFRAIKYSKQYEAFKTNDVTPKDPIELKFDLSVCKSLSVTTNYLPNTFKIFPNPAKNSITLDVEFDTIEIYNLLGNRVLKKQKTKFLNIKDLKSGIYFIKAYQGNRVISERFIKR